MESNLRPINIEIITVDTSSIIERTEKSFKWFEDYTKSMEIDNSKETFKTPLSDKNIQFGSLVGLQLNELSEINSARAKLKIYEVLTEFSETELKQRMKLLKDELMTQ